MTKEETLKIIEQLFSSDEDEVIYALSVVKKQGNNKKIVGKIINYNKVLVEL